MKNLKKTLFCAAFILSLISLNVFAQDDVTYVDDAAAEDSSYIEDIFMAEEEGEYVEETGNSKTGLYVAIGAILLVGIGFVLLKKKK